MEFTFPSQTNPNSFESPPRSAAQQESSTFTGMAVSPCSLYKEPSCPSEGEHGADHSAARFDQWLTATDLLVARSTPLHPDAVKSPAATEPSFCFSSWLQATEAAAASPSLSSRKSPKPTQTPTHQADTQHQHGLLPDSPAWLQQSPVANDSSHADNHASPPRHREVPSAPAQEFVFHTPSAARPSRGLQSGGDQEQRQTSGGRGNFELAWPCTGDGLPPPTRHFHTDGQRAYDSMQATPASCYGSVTPLPGVGACSGRLDYGSDEDTPGSDFSSRTNQPEIGAMLARMALRPAQTGVQQHEQTSQGTDYFRQLNAASHTAPFNAAPPKSPEQRVIELMVEEGVSTFGGFGAATTQQRRIGEGQEVESGPQHGLQESVQSPMLQGEKEAGEGGVSTASGSKAQAEIEAAGEEASPQRSYTSSSGDELDAALAQQLTPTSFETARGDVEYQPSPMADLILMMMSPSPVVDISVLDE